jgi:hypothetical protein
VKSRSIAVGAFFSLLFGLEVAAQNGYRIGQSVYWRDDSAGGWVKATITRDYGRDSVEQYLIKIEGRRGEESARIGMLRPADGSPRPPMPTSDPFKLQQLYGFHPERDDWPLPGEAKITPVAPAPRPVAAPAERPIAAVPVTSGAAQARPRADAAVLGTGKFQNGERMGTPGQTNFRLDKGGRKQLVAVATPGDESFLGRWDLKAGGSWSVSDRKDLGGGRVQVTESYNFPVKADVLVISQDGTWFKQFSGKRTSGKWMDLGQNVVQLVGFEEDDWTGSVLKGELTIRGWIGTWEYGRRF